MASLGAGMVSQVFSHSDAEKAFRPWWDNFKDYLVYALVMLGKLLLTVISTIDLRNIVDLSFPTLVVMVQLSVKVD